MALRSIQIVCRVVLKGNKMGGKAICTFLITLHCVFHQIQPMGISLCSELFSKKYQNAPLQSYVLHSLIRIQYKSSFYALKEK